MRAGPHAIRPLVWGDTRSPCILRDVHAHARLATYGRPKSKGLIRRGDFPIDTAPEDAEHPATSPGSWVYILLAVTTQRGNVMKIVRASLLCVLAGLIAGCFNLGTKPSEITPAYVPASQYENYDCKHLSIELADLSRREGELVAAQNQRRQSSKVQAFWVGFGQGDGVAASELAYVKGALLAVQKQQALKNCPANS